MEIQTFSSAEQCHIEDTESLNCVSCFDQKPSENNTKRYNGEPESTEKNATSCIILEVGTQNLLLAFCHIPSLALSEIPRKGQYNNQTETEGNIKLRG